MTLSDLLDSAEGHLLLMVRVRVFFSTRANNKKILCVRLWKETCFCRRVLLPPFFLSFFFFSHPESCLKIEIFGRSDVLGGAQGRLRSPGRGGEKRENEKKTWKKTPKNKNEKNEKVKNMKNERMRKMKK